MEDLEAGPETILSTGDTSRASNQDVEGSFPSPTTMETTTSGTNGDGARPPISQNDTAGNAKTFTEFFGQSLFLVVNTGPAVAVPVYRPSVHCAQRMEALEEGYVSPEKGDDKLKPLLSPPPKKDPWCYIPRWRELREAHPGELEVDVWERIKQECESRRPRWHAFLPFWGVVVVEERDLLLRIREGAQWGVKIQPAVDIQEKRRNLLSKLAEVKSEIDKYAEYDYNCKVEQDAFGDWYTKEHDENCCRKGVAIDVNKGEDFVVFQCDKELGARYQSRYDNLKRLSDFVDCFKNPSAAKEMLPLTTGGALDSCIHDNVKIDGLELRDRSHPNRQPPRINGLVVEYQFSGSRTKLEVSASSLFVFVVILVWKLVTGDWSVAAAFGSLCVALMALAYQRSQTLTDPRTKSTKVD